MEIAKDQPGVSQKPRQTSALFDENYLQALARGDPEAEDFLVAHFSGAVRLKLRGRLRSISLVQDAHKETFLRVLRYFRQGKTLDNPAGLPDFVRTVCHNVELEFLRSHIEQRRNLVITVLSDMPEKDRELLCLVWLDEKDKDAACRELGVDRNYLRLLLQRARNRFRKRTVFKTSRED
jgi:DNA-directed RNA polymerase specialized sigma24 family protein